MRKVSAITLLLFSSASFAQSYQTFTHLNVHKLDTSGTESASLYGQYFFEEKTALGPLDQFEYINKTSNIGGHATDVPGEHYYYGFNGQAFIGNVLIGGGYSNNSLKQEHENLQIGYLLNDDFLVRVSARKSDFFDTVYTLSSRYNFQINETDYVGVTISADDEFEHKSISSKYFSKVGDSQHYTADLYYSRNDSHEYWRLSSSFYFTERTSVNANYDKDKYYNIGAKHFFSNNFAIGANYYSNSDNSDYKHYSVYFSTQF